MAESLDKREDVAAISSQINALSIYEKHLMEARTWPYNFSMLRTLFFSVLIPVFTMLATRDCRSIEGLSRTNRVAANVAFAQPQRNRNKERLIISSIGSERLCAEFGNIGKVNE